MKDWDIIADNLSKAGFSCGCVSAIDSNGRPIWIADAHRGGNADVCQHRQLGRAASISAQRRRLWFAIATVVAAFDSYRFGCRITPALSASRSTLQ
jgi:hypothetical protein